MSGKPGEAEHEDPHRNAEERTLPAEAGERVERDRALQLAFPRGHDGEGADRHRPVGNEVVEECPAAELVRGRDRDQHEARMGDGRVGEQPFHVALHERGEIADRERRTGEHGDRDPPLVLLAGERRRQHAQRDDERRCLRRRRHERGHRGRRALVDVRRPHVERRRRGLEAEAGDDHREPGEQEGVARRLGGADRGEAELPGRAVDERGAEEQHRRPERADDQVLEPRLERGLAVGVHRAEDVEADREPLEPEEEREQVPRGDEEEHPRAGRGEQRVVLAAVEAPPLAPRDQDRERAGAAEHDLSECGPAVARHRLGDQRHGLRRPVEDRAGEDGRGDEPCERDERPEAAPQRLRHEHRAEQRHGGGPEQSQDGREREPVDVRGVDHGPASSQTVIAVTKLPSCSIAAIALSLRSRSSLQDCGASSSASVGETWAVSSPWYGTRTLAKIVVPCAAVRDPDQRCGRVPREGAGADRRRPDREPEQERDERHDDPELRRPQVERRVADRRAARPVQHGRDQPQHVHRGEHDRARADGRVAPALLEDAGEDRELAGERRRAGHGERDDPGRHQQRGERRSALRHPAEQGEVAGRGAPLDHPGEQEHRRRDQAVVDRLQDRAVEAEVVEGEDPERDQAHLRHRRVGQHSAQVGRTEREQRAVDEPDRREDEDRHGEVVGGLGELRDRDPDEAVDGRLRDDPGEHRRDLRRRLAVGVEQPAVEGEERRLDRERDREAEEDPVVRARAPVDERERPLRDPVDDDRGQHQERAGHRVEDELDRRAEPARPAPDADQHVDRDQHRLEEDVEEEQVLGDEDADDRAGEEEHQAAVGSGPVAADDHRVAERGRADDRRQPDQPEREAVEADVVADAEVGEPVEAGLLLQQAVAEVEPPERRDPECDLAERDEERQAGRELARQRRQPDEERSREGKQDQGVGQGHVSAPRRRRR